MTRFFAVIGLIFVCVVGLGFYFGYLRIGADSADGTSHIVLTVEQKKLQDDEKKAVEKVQGRE